MAPANENVCILLSAPSERGLVKQIATDQFAPTLWLSGIGPNFPTSGASPHCEAQARHGSFMTQCLSTEWCVHWPDSKSCVESLLNR